MTIGTVTRRRHLSQLAGPITAVIALTLVIALLGPTAAHWAGDAGSAMGMGTGSASILIDGEFAFEIPGCRDTTHGEGKRKHPCFKGSSQTADITNTGSIPLRLDLTLQMNSCDIDGLIGRVGPADQTRGRTPDESSAFRLCGPGDVTVALTDQLDPGDTFSMRLTLSAKRAIVDPPTTVTGLAAVSASQWNTDDGWATVESVPLVIEFPGTERDHDPTTPPPAPDPESDDTSTVEDPENPQPPPVDNEQEEPCEDATGTPPPPDDPPSSAPEAPPTTDPPTDDPGSPAIVPNPASLGEISGIVWLDDGDGYRVDGSVEEELAAEPGSPDVTVSLHDPTTGLVSVTTTDDEGQYRFDGLSFGTYLVRFEAPQGYEFVLCCTDEDPNLDTDVARIEVIEAEHAVPTWGWTSELMLSESEREVVVDAALTASPRDDGTSTDKVDQQRDGTASGIVWFDDGDAIREDPLSGPTSTVDLAAAEVVVELFDEEHTLVAATVTQVDGSYEFTGFGHGHYRVRFSAPDGFTFVSSHMGSDPSIDSDIDENETVDDRIYGWSGLFVIDDSQPGSVDAGLLEIPTDDAEDVEPVTESDAGAGDT